MLKSRTQWCSDTRNGETYSDDQDPLNEGQAEAGDGAVTTRCRGGQAEWQEEPDPVEEERHWGEERKSKLKRPYILQDIPK